MDKAKNPQPKVERFAASVMPTKLEDANSVDVLLYTGAKVERFDWMTGERYMLQLSLDPKQVDVSQLDGAPLLDSHNDYSIASVYGVFSDGRLTKEGLVGTARFSNRPDPQATLADIHDGIITQVSVGAVIKKLKDVTPEGAKKKEYLAVDWYPREGSLVPIAADSNAGFLSATEIVSGLVEERATAQGEKSMVKTLDQAALEPAAAIDQAALAAVRTAEKLRQSEIRKIGASVKFTAAEIDGHIEKDTPVEEVRRLALEYLAGSQNGNDTRSQSTVHVVRDERETVRNLAGERIMNLFDQKNKIDPQNDFRGMGILRLAEETLSRAGVNVRGKTRSEIAELSMHGTADFPLILADSARKQMLNAYGVATPTYKIWTKTSTTPDFKTMSRLRLGETPSFLKVPEGAQITLGTMTESREQYAIATYGRGVSFTRQALINDDLGAFLDLLTAFGYQAARLENKTVYALLQANANMSDGVALFYASHGNLGTGVIGNAGLDAMFIAMAGQKGLDGATVLNLIPKYLIVPVAKASTAQNALTATGANLKPADQNWFAGRLTVVADAELDNNGSGTTVWYGAADEILAPGIEYAHLEGASGPQMIRKDNEEAILGVQLYAFLDFGAKAVDWRPLYKSSGS